ncbi:hypothetical protein T4B_4872 [Trichinella pseudospiralis]|uniref:Uncharacterized protein n=1 Tax=Trichinella pseudospiralis TaxID=6337 RepID=A0A0V1IMY5_TRIPS|nr:hypothetical protein T4B_4872 [Trichinella pseudospiralis]
MIDGHHLQKDLKSKQTNKQYFTLNVDMKIKFSNKTVSRCSSLPVLKLCCLNCPLSELDRKRIVSKRLTPFDESINRHSFYTLPSSFTASSSKMASLCHKYERKEEDWKKKVEPFLGIV